MKDVRFAVDGTGVTGTYHTEHWSINVTKFSVPYIWLSRVDIVSAKPNNIGGAIVNLFSSSVDHTFETWSS